MGDVSAEAPTYRTVTPHLIVRGGEAALEFYAKAFGAVEDGRMLTPDGKLMHGSMRVGDSRIMLGEENPGWGTLSPLSLKGTPVTIHLHVEDADAAFARAVEAGCTVRMPPMNMFWGDRYGVVIDPFGHSWSLAHTVESLTYSEMAERGEKWMAQQRGGCAEVAETEAAAV